jgi:hypothetical protein
MHQRAQRVGAQRLVAVPPGVLQSAAARGDVRQPRQDPRVVRLEFATCSRKQRLKHLALFSLTNWMRSDGNVACM